MPARTHRNSAAFKTAIALLSMAMLFGGGQGGLGDTLTQLTALALLGLMLRHQPDVRRWPKASRLALLPVLPLLVFLMPWPDAWVTSGQARTALAEALHPVIGPWGVQGSLVPLSTERALLWLLPALALYLASLQFSMRKRKTLAAVLLFWLLVNAVTGLAQRAAGPDSLLYFFANTNKGAAVGLFANANHYAIALAAGLPLVWASLTWLFNRRAEKPVNPLWFPVLAGIAILFILGFMLSGSRAGLALGMLGCFLMLPAVIAADTHDGAKRWLFAVLAVGLFLTVQTGLYFVVLQFDTGPFEDLRWQFADITGQAALAHAPAGSGPGSFWFVFPHFDQLLVTGNVIVNHAHNDYLELWLEARWLFLLTALPLLTAYFWQGARLWFRSGDYSVSSVLLARAAWVGILLLLLHSFVDYPLRTTALSAMAGLLAGFLYLPASERQEPAG